MKMPDEIKRGVACCCSPMDGRSCHACPYDSVSTLTEVCSFALKEDINAYIRQLEAQRDAAVNDLGVVRDCKVCKHFSHKAYEEPCGSCGIRQAHWEWRGAKMDDKGVDAHNLEGGTK